LFYFEALPLFGQAYALTLRLNDNVESKARAHGANCLDWLYRRVRDTLTRIVGRPLPLCLTLEASRGRLHLHGGIACTDGEYKLVRRALKTAGGLWLKNGRQFQLKMQASPDARGAGYALKEIHKTRPARRALMKKLGVEHSRWVAVFEGRGISACHRLRAKAKMLHAAAVQYVKASRTSSLV
jgi:hypothetical protein